MKGVLSFGIVPFMSRKIENDLERGKRLRYVRTEILGLRSQEAFASWIGGVTRGAVGNWELGKDISLDNLVTIADKSGISLEWLAYNKGPKPTKTIRKPPQDPSDDQFLEAMKSFRALPDADQKRFLQYVLGLAEPDQAQQQDPASQGKDGKKQR